MTDDCVHGVIGSLRGNPEGLNQKSVKSSDEAEMMSTHCFYDFFARIGLDGLEMNPPEPNPDQIFGQTRTPSRRQTDQSQNGKWSDLGVRLVGDTDQDFLERQPDSFLCLCRIVRFVPQPFL